MVIRLWCSVWEIVENAISNWIIKIICHYSEETYFLWLKNAKSENCIFCSKIDFLNVSFIIFEISALSSTKIILKASKMKNQNLQRLSKMKHFKVKDFQNFKHSKNQCLNPPYFSVKIEIASKLPNKNENCKINNKTFELF